MNRLQKGSRIANDQILGESIAAGVGIGLAVGAGIGVALHNIALGIGVGIAMGVGIGRWASAIRARKATLARQREQLKTPRKTLFL
jgi:hypothetical protein